MQDTFGRRCPALSTINEVLVPDAASGTALAASMSMRTEERPDFVPRPVRVHTVARIRLGTTGKVLTLSGSAIGVLDQIQVDGERFEFLLYETRRLPLPTP